MKNKRNVEKSQERNENWKLFNFILYYTNKKKYELGKKNNFVQILVNSSFFLFLDKDDFFLFSHEFSYNFENLYISSIF